MEKTVNHPLVHPSVIEIISSLLFLIAIIHTFLINKFKMIAIKYAANSIKHNFWHLLSDIEIVFGLWSFVFLGLFILTNGLSSTVIYLESLNFTEPAFVFVIMCMAATRPIIMLAEKIIHFISTLLPFSERLSFYISALVIGPILGSFITEPAAMTVSALILLDTIFKEKISLKLKYATIALLFVNVSIGGTLTHFAAPPVLMVASKWQWGTLFMLEHFGYKSLLAILVSTSLYAYYFRHELIGVSLRKSTKEKKKIIVLSSGKSFILVVIHLLFLFSVVYFSHHPKVFIALFFLFQGLMIITEKYQDKLKIKESFLVSFFLAGLVCLGTMQAWWLKPVLSQMADLTLLIGATLLTSLTDNAALTYLGSLVELSDSGKYSLVAGAIAGGGLTVIANAPNPAGFAILGESFGKEGINPFKLFLWALIPTVIGILCLLFLPNIIL
ncbi:MAG: putative Na+/H+ antiporter [Bacteriovorax sp.]|nr:putative Na+/H+ antiporter [Bacteriovorax sp.]